MRILDIDDNEILNPDYALGYLRDETIIIQHHDAIEPVEEVSHYEVIAEYPNGGKDIAKIIDVPRREAQPAWDETEDIYRYILYTEEELERRRQEEQDADKTEEAMKHISEMLETINALLGVLE